MRAALLTLVSYTVCVAVATYPMAVSFSSKVPNLGDPLEHLWIMRWYKSCLLDGRSPFCCPELHAPVGVPLGYFPPMQLQTLLYVPLSLVLDNDALCYNLIWLFGFLMMGMGTFLLAWHVLRNRHCAWFAGLLAMLSTPMMMHGHGHLETMQAGGFPLFLVSWLRFWDEPDKRRLMAAVGAYLFLVMSAPYFLVLSVFPAGWYLIWRGIRAARAGEFVAWTRPRLVWLGAFTAIVFPGVLLLFSSQIWAALHGASMARPESEFCHFGTRLWTYVFPTTFHRLYGWLPYSPYVGSDRARTLYESGSYLGIVAIALILFAILARVKFDRAAYWWTSLALVVVLSLGAKATYDGHQFSLPSYWLYRIFPPYRLIRVPARFNLFAAVIAALIAAAGLRAILRALPGIRTRAAVVVALAIVTLGDLAMVPFAEPASIPAVPPIYETLLREQPDATLLEVPQFRSDGSLLNCICGYWQGIHRGKTSAGYSGHPNRAYDNLLLRTSPFDGERLADPAFLESPHAEKIDLLSDVEFDNYAWLYLNHHRFPFVLLHHSELTKDKGPLAFGRLRERLSQAKLFEDEKISVYETARLRPPTRLTILLAQGWRQRATKQGELSCAVGKSARIVVYQPNPSEQIILSFVAASFREPRTVRLTSRGHELARWELQPDHPESIATPPFKLPAGTHELILASETESRPAHNHEMASEGDRTPYSLRVSGVSGRSLPTVAGELSERRIDYCR